MRRLVPLRLWLRLETLFGLERVWCMLWVSLAVPLVGEVVVNLILVNFGSFLGGMISESDLLVLLETTGRMVESLLVEL